MTTLLSDLPVMRYVLEYAPYARKEGTPGVYLERVSWGGAERWAIRTTTGECLARSDQWFDEPQPSERSDEYLNECRFDNAQQALTIWENSQSRHRYITGQLFVIREWGERESR